MSAVLTRILKTGLFVLMGFIFAALAQARPFQASVTTNAQTMGIKVTLPEGNEIKNNLDQSIKDYARLSLQENLQIARHLFTADWSLLSAANDDVIFQMSLNDDTLDRNQEPVPAGNMTHLLWGMTYCRKRNELMQMPHENPDENTGVAALLMQNEDVDQQMTCLKEYIIQCPTSRQTTYSSPPELDAMEVEEFFQNLASLPRVSDTNDDNDDGTGGNNPSHTYDRRPTIFCPACSQKGCKAPLPPYNPRLAPINAVFEYAGLFELLFEGIQAPDESKELTSRADVKTRNAGKPVPSKSSKKKRKRRGMKKAPPLQNRLLLHFMLRILYTEEGRNIVHWENKDTGVFKILDSSELAEKWGAEKGGRKKAMTWEKMSRAIRYGYKNGRGPIEKDGMGRRLIYQVTLENNDVQKIMKKNNYNQ